MKQIAFLAAICPVLAALHAPEADACSCMRPPPASTALEQADAVFVGKVVSVETAGDQDGQPIGSHREVDFAIEHVFKGPAEEKLVVVTATNSAACGVNFEVGERWLVYAHDSDGTLGAGLCSRTKRVAEAAEDLDVLAPGLAESLMAGDSLARPAPSPPPNSAGSGQPPPHKVPPRSRGCGSCAVAPAATWQARGGLAVLVFGLLVSMRRRASRRG